MRRVLAPAVLCCFCTGAHVVRLDAASELNFAWVSFSSDSIIGIAIVNPTEADATIELAAYGEDGQLLQAPHNPVGITVEAGRQYARTALEIFGTPQAPDAPAWVRGYSESDDLAGFFLYLDPSVSFFDGAEIPEPYEEIVFNEIRTDAEHATQLSIANPNEDAAEVDLLLYAGGLLQTVELSLPGFAVKQLDVETSFDLSESLLGEPAESAFLVARSTLPLVGCEFVRTGKDIVGLSARPKTEAQTRLVFPQLAVLDPFVSELTIVNYLEQAVLVTVSARKPNGELHQPGAGSNPVTLALGPHEANRRNLEELFGFTGEGILEGWLEVEASTAAINGLLTYSIPSIGSIAAVSSVIQGSETALFSHIATSLGFFTGLALLNAGSLTANVQILAVQPDGTPVGSHSAALQPGERVSRLIDEFVPDAEGMAGGFIWVSSDLPVYMTSLFGSSASGVLANIPPQPVPEDFEPLGTEAPMRVSPALALVQPGRDVSFSTVGTTAAEVVWSVNSVVGGDATLGRISSSGVYSAPAELPEELPVSVTATYDGSSAGATVDLVSKEQFLSGLGLIQSVAYFQSARRLYLAELQAVGGAGFGPSQVPATAILDATSGAPTEVIRLEGESVSKMLPYTAVDGREYLLLAGQASGSIIRLDPERRRTETVISGLDAPSSLAIDPVDEQLLVAEAEEVSFYDLEVLNSGLSAQNSGDEDWQVAAVRQKLFEASKGNIEVDQCSGNIYASIRDEGVVLEYVRLTGALRTLVSGLDRPGALLGLYRRGVSCPAAFHLMVAELGRRQLTLVVPFDRTVRPWTEAPEVSDIILLPETNPFSGGSALLLVDRISGSGRVQIVPLPDLYLPDSVNPPRRPPLGPCTLGQITDTTEFDAGAALLSGNGDFVYFSSRADITEENPENNREVFRFDRRARAITQVTQSGLGESTAIASTRDGRLLLLRSTARLVENAPPAFSLFLHEFDSAGFRAVPFGNTQGASMDSLGTLVALASRSDPVGQNREGNSEIFLLGVEDFSVEQLTVSESGANVAPVLSDDGKALAFYSTANLEGSNPGGDVALYLLDLEGDVIHFVAILGQDSPPENLPVLNTDGSYLVFSSRSDLLGQNPRRRQVVFVFSRDSGSLTQVTPPGADSVVSSISGDGKTLAGVTSGDPVRLNRDGNREVVFRILPDGPVVQVTRSRRAENLFPVLSNDGAWVVFESDADYLGRNADRNVEVFLGYCRP